jgi:predicted transcriptional regulator
MADPVVRLTANLSPQVAAQLDSLAALLRTTKTQALNQAITTAVALYRAQEAGGQVVVRNGNTQQEVDLPTNNS